MRFTAFSRSVIRISWNSPINKKKTSVTLVTEVFYGHFALFLPLKFEDITKNMPTDISALVYSWGNAYNETELIFLVGVLFYGQPNH